MKAISYRTNEGVRTGLLVSTGRKYHKVILMDNPIKMIAVPLRDERYFTDLLYKHMPYPVRRAKRIFRKAVVHYHGSLRNVSKEVQEALR